MQDLVSRLGTHRRYLELESAIREGDDCYAEGLWGSAAPLLIAALAMRVQRTVLCIVPHVEQADEFVEDISLFAPDLPLLFPPRESLDDEQAPDADILSRRLAVLKDLAIRRTSARPKAGRVVVAPVQAALQLTPSPATMEENALSLSEGTVRPPEEITAWLAEHGFQPVRQIEVPGEFCKRGGIVDVFPYASEAPVRIEFCDDAVESLRTFDPATQASLSPVKTVTVNALPRRRSTPTSVARAAWAPLFGHLPEDTLIAIREPAEVFDRADAFTDEEPAIGPILRAAAPETGKGVRPAATLQRETGAFQRLLLTALPGVFGGKPIGFHVHSVERFVGNIETTLRELDMTVADREQTIVLCNNAGEKRRLIELLGASSVLKDPRFEIRVGRMNRGFDWSGLSLAVLTHHEMFHRYRERRAAPRFRHTRAIDNFVDLQPGDPVVHVTHGIGIYRNMELLDRDGQKEECLCIEYAERSLLYVPVSRIELVQKYVGPAECRPPLSRLGTTAWAKRKQRAESAVRDLAADLLRMQVLREGTIGIAHPSDGEWQREFENAFPYEETEDQLRVAEEVKRDMEQERPADRLICGDVGYGKTEIAMRAAFKAVMGGRQVAMLAPTTILADQHLRTFRERVADYPVRVEMLSRFVLRSEQTQVIARLADGRADIVIGTHRLIQPDVRFKDLGLVIIDEEQRFGVAHKERLKKLRETVDVLTLTATPIPRTLHMSLLGLRDISSLDTPIRDRLAVSTRLIRSDPHRIRQAILHELARDGQVFFLHNRVETIAGVARRLRKLAPEAAVVVGHGQMPEKALAEVMHQFIAHKADILVCTTIIESGLDIPNANTIIIDRADMFGLADLHQLRGRVGRYKRRAYAYLLAPTDRPVTPVAEKRLKAIEEFAELGAGFRIALRDLEIRGAGNILGPQQSGHLAAVGYDMYCRLLERAVRERKNEPEPEQLDVSVAVGLETFLPDDYVPDPAQRIDLYRKFHRAESKDDVDLLRAEVQDRYGALPAQVENMFAETRLRQLAGRAGIRAITVPPELRAGAHGTPAHFRQRYPIVLQCARQRRVISILEDTDQMYRVIDDQTIHLRARLDASRTGRPDGIAGEIVVSFLVDLLAHGLSAISQDE